MSRMVLPTGMSAAAQPRLSASPANTALAHTTTPSTPGFHNLLPRIGTTQAGSQVACKLVFSIPARAVPVHIVKPRQATVVPRAIPRPSGMTHAAASTPASTQRPSHTTSSALLSPDAAPLPDAILRLQDTRLAAGAGGSDVAAAAATTVAAPQASSQLQATVQPDVVPGQAAVSGAAALTAIVAAAAGVCVHQFSHAVCSTAPAGCVQIPSIVKVPLIATHLFSFVLLPAAMYVFFKRAPRLAAWGAASPVQPVAGLLFLMVGIACEIGWHVQQQWYYQEEYNLLNYMFSLFMGIGTSLWALGVRPIRADSARQWADAADKFLLAAPALIALAYGLGAAVTHTKVPMFILMTGQYALLSWRLYKLLQRDKRVFLFPFFSVGVNLAFVTLLNRHKHDVLLNPLFHLLHDAAGTELGVVIITLLVWYKAADLDENAGQSKLD